MSLQKKIEEEIKSAMKAKDKLRLQALRSIKSQILLAKSEKGAGEELGEERELQILMKAAKQRKDSLEIYEKEGREDLAATERAELEIIEEFLPKMMTPDEVRTEVSRILEQIGANSPKDMGKAMGAVMKQLAGKAENKTISAIVKELLAN